MTESTGVAYHPHHGYPMGEALHLGVVWQGDDSGDALTEDVIRWVTEIVSTGGAWQVDDAGTWQCWAEGLDEGMTDPAHVYILTGTLADDDVDRMRFQLAQALGDDYRLTDYAVVSDADQWSEGQRIVTKW